MTRSQGILVAAVILVGLPLSLVAWPVQPYDGETMDVLSRTGATIENWEAQDFEVLAPNGEPVPFSRFDGRLVYLNYWAEWCEVCKTELPVLDVFARQNQSRIDVVTVSIDEDPTAAFRYLQQHFPQGAGFLVLTDPGGASTVQFGTTGVPETFVIDPEGTVLARYIGFHDFTSPDHQRMLNHILRERR